MKRWDSGSSRGLVPACSSSCTKLVRSGTMRIPRSPKRWRRKDRFELDGVLGAVPELLLEQVHPRAALQRLHEVPVDLEGAEGRVVRLQRGGRGARDPLVWHAQDDVEVRRLRLRQRAIG